MPVLGCTTDGWSKFSGQQAGWLYPGIPSTEGKRVDRNAGETVLFQVDMVFYSILLGSYILLVYCRRLDPCWPRIRQVHSFHDPDLLCELFNFYYSREPPKRNDFDLSNARNL